MSTVPRIDDHVVVTSDVVAEAPSGTADEGLSPWQSIRAYTQAKPLQTAVGLWATLMVGTGLYVYKRKSMTLSQKIIHARLVAQAGVLTGICSAAAINVISGGSVSGINTDPEYAALARYHEFDRPEFRKFQEDAYVKKVQRAATGATIGAPTKTE